ncbi:MULTISPECIES: TolC family protein [unclassified Paraflavitalea]|uniref:TolC family protein n=1 Tax=unclassified Paraflavitalea TaxID=2798305 RepID=UPI003D342AF1
MKYFVFCLNLILIASFAKAQEVWDLKTCVDYAIANNISVKQADIDARRAQLTLKANQYNQYPSLTFSVSGGVNSGRSIDPTTNQFTQQQLLSSGISLQSGVTLFNWFSIKNNIAGAGFDAQAASANIDKVKNDIALNVAVAYLQILVSQEQANISRVALQQSQQNYMNTKKRVDAGALPELNLAETEAQVARDSATYISSLATVQTNILNLKAVLNLDAAQAFQVSMPPLDQIPVESLNDLQPEVVFSLALTNLPQQKINDLRIKAANKYLAATKSAMYPSIGMFGTLGSNYANNKIPKVTSIATGNYIPTAAKVNVSGTDYSVLTPEVNTSITTSRTAYGVQISDNFRQNVGIQLNVPIFNNGAAKLNYQRNQLTVKSLQLTKEQVDRTLKQDIYAAYNNATNSLQRYYATIKSVETAEKAFSFAQKRYDLGLLTTIDYITNQNNLTRAKLERASAQVDYVFRMKLLEFYKGQGLKL